MNPTSDVLKRITNSSKSHPDGVFTRLYRYLLREDIYLTAYKNLYANDGASTKGTDNDTADGFGEEYVAKTIEELRTLTYQPKPVRRTYIPKRNGKLRPLGVPSFRDKLIQDAIRQILEAIYEPVFSDVSHGFRPNRSCHTALNAMRYGFNGVTWFIEGDIKGCFDNIDHKVLLGILAEKIKDSKFINLIGAFLKAGYLEDWEYHNTGPQAARPLLRLHGLESPRAWRTRHRLSLTLRYVSSRQGHVSLPAVFIGRFKQKLLGDRLLKSVNELPAFQPGDHV